MESVVSAVFIDRIRKNGYTQVRISKHIFLNCIFRYCNPVTETFKIGLNNSGRDGECIKKTGAVLVAAGMSSRMKAFKQMLPFGDSTISFHIISMLKQLGIDPIVVVTGYLAKKLESHLSFTGVRFVKNERYGETQMFDSVRLGIHAISHDCERIMIIPMDVPAIMLETFHQILKIDADLVRTVYKGEPGHPIIVRNFLSEQLCRYDGAMGLRGAALLHDVARHKSDHALAGARILMREGYPEVADIVIRHHDWNRNQAAKMIESRINRKMQEAVII